MLDKIKQEAIRVIRAFGAGAIAVTALAAYGFVSGWKQCGSADSALAGAYIALILVYPALSSVRSSAGSLAAENTSIIFLVFCLLPSVAAALLVANAGAMYGWPIALALKRGAAGLHHREHAQQSHARCRK